MVPPGPAPARLLPEQAFGLRSLGLLRAATQAHAAAAGLPQARAEDLTLAGHELAANAIQHGAGHGRLQIWHQDRALICQVDDGPPARPRPGPASGGNPAAGWPRAKPHGLWLVGELADRMSVTSGTAGTRATAAFTLPAATRWPGRPNGCRTSSTRRVNPGDLGPEGRDQWPYPPGRPAGEMVACLSAMRRGRRSRPSRRRRGWTARRPATH